MDSNSRKIKMDRGSQKINILIFKSSQAVWYVMEHYFPIHLLPLVLVLTFHFHIGDSRANIEREITRLSAVYV